MKPYSVTLQWGDGEYAFALPIGVLRELQAAAGCGVGTLYRRLATGDYYADDAYQIIRLALIGGGTPPAEALRLANFYVLERPLGESVPFALGILLSRLFSPADDAGKAPAPGEAETPRAE